MSSIKLPLSPMWRMFDVDVDEDLAFLSWTHAGPPALSAAERYILDVASNCPVEVLAGVTCWCFELAMMDVVSTMLIDAQEDENAAVTMAWLMFDTSLMGFKRSELAGPHRKGASDAA